MAKNAKRDANHHDDDDDEPRPKKARKRRHVEDDAPTTKKAPSPLWALVLLVPLIGIAVFMGIWQIRGRSSERAAFAAEMDKLVAPPAPGPVKATPGKVAFIDVDKRELHYLHDRNMGPEANTQAATPQETVTVVHVRVTDKVVREYLNGRKGVKQTFHQTLIDKATWTRIDEKTFEGGDPPESIRASGGGTNEPVNGPLPSKEIYAYLRGICRE
jgi:hypothetical protein